MRGRLAVIYSPLGLEANCSEITVWTGLVGSEAWEETPSLFPGVRGDSLVLLSLQIQSLNLCLCCLSFPRVHVCVSSVINTPGMLHLGSTLMTSS